MTRPRVFSVSDPGSVVEGTCRRVDPADTALVVRAAELRYFCGESITLNVCAGMLRSPRNSSLKSMGFTVSLTACSRPWSSRRVAAGGLRPRSGLASSCDALLPLRLRDRDSDDRALGRARDGALNIGRDLPGLGSG